MALFVVILLLNCLILVTRLAATQPGDAPAVLHLPLSRRGSRFSRREAANITYLADVLRAVQAKYAPSYREVQGNRLVRRWRVDENNDENDPHLIDVAGHLNRWWVSSAAGIYFTLLTRYILQVHTLQSGRATAEPGS
jgi:hypothetical protein